MTRTRTIAAIWLLGAIALFGSWYLGEPRRPLALIAAVLFVAVAVMTLVRERRPPPSAR